MLLQPVAKQRASPKSPAPPSPHASPATNRARLRTAACGGAVGGRQRPRCRWRALPALGMMHACKAAVQLESGRAIHPQTECRKARRLRRCRCRSPPPATTTRQRRVALRRRRPEDPDTRACSGAARPPGCGQCRRLPVSRRGQHVAW
eukprot:19718-Chlamydomonas_euryale.AAC.2